VGSAWGLTVLTTSQVKNKLPGSHGLAQLEAAGATIQLVEPLPTTSEFSNRHSRKSKSARSPVNKGSQPTYQDPLDNFYKLNLWRLEGFERIVYLNADTLVVKNIDRLFGYPQFSAAPNLHESLLDMQHLNSGVFVAEPSIHTFERMLSLLNAPDAYWPGTDQTFLEQFFPNWHGLPYTFNTQQYVFFKLPQLWQWRSINVVQYQFEKPWQEHNPRRAELLPLIELWHQMLAGEPPPDELRTPHA